MPRLVFERAVALLRLIRHALEATAQAAAAQSELEEARRQLEQAGIRETWLPERLSPHLPAESAAHPAPSGHARQIVQAMLSHTHANYHHPLSLGEVAVHLRMNPNYLSGLFHQTTGVTFHRYLEDLRLTKAEGLLCDPCARICEVAFAVGFASPDHFRKAFRAREGRPPNVWRQSVPPVVSKAGSGPHGGAERTKT